MDIIIDIHRLTTEINSNDNLSKINYIILNDGTRIDVSDKKARLFLIKNNSENIIFSLNLQEDNFLLDLKENKLDSGTYLCQLELSGLYDYRKYSHKFYIDIVKVN
ncbi:hypothetical protein [Clostridium baratii]|uniref:hypothetical protein n=1 Tax=Clostridium baratii TaxID=1561 RepID=UPI002900D801|nr:hypothetical protein [Clostridium baratii]MDU1053453.1 hypothetical protein [Clostridium baratii]